MPAYAPLPQAETATGGPRRIGVEIEFGGLSVAEAVAIARDALGADAPPDSGDQHKQRLDIPGLGEFRFELDMARRHREAFAHKEGEEDDPLRQITGEIVNWLAPVEMVAPPLPVNQLAELHPLIARLRRAEATGAGHGAQTAYGMHFNVEITSDAITDILPQARAFALLEDWLRLALQIAMNRRLTGFVKAYPREFIDLVADPDYVPTRAQFFEDYLRLNPTRNRALDLTPIIDQLDPDRADAALGGEKRSPRPTFHYRLPDARVDEMGWTPRRDWMLWRLVERAAADPDLTLALQIGWQEHRADWSTAREDWVKRCADMLRAAGLIDRMGEPRE